MVIIPRELLCSDRGIHTMKRIAKCQHNKPSLHFGSDKIGSREFIEVVGKLAYDVSLKRNEANLFVAFLRQQL